MTKSFYTTKPYREARQRAERDLANWPDSGIGQMKIKHNWPDSIEKQEAYYLLAKKRERHGVLGILCAGLSLAIIIIYFGVYHYARTYTPSPTIVHQSSGL